jgi:Cu/Ag efflux protein CusF
MNNPLNLTSSRLVLFCLCVFLAFSVACSHGKPPASTAISPSSAKRYSLKGKVISVDKNAGTANINNEPIADFMDTMIMPYTIKPAAGLDQLQPGDSVAADVVVEGDKYWLENVRVIAHAKPSADKPLAVQP